MKTSKILSLTLICFLFTACNTRQNKPVEEGQPPSSEEQKPQTSEEVLGAVEKAKDAITVNYGTSFGMCLGYCRTEMKVTSKGIKHVRTARSRNKDENVKPTLINGIPFTETERDALLSSIDLEAFFKMDTVVGCPDCADGGSEWIEIGRDGETHKVTIEYYANVEGLTAAMQQLRKLDKSAPKPQ